MALSKPDDLALKLTQLGKRCCAHIVSIGDAASESESDLLSARRLRQMGFEEEKEIEILHAAPFGRDPIAVRVDRAVLAIRRAEAALVTVKAS